MDKAIKYLIDQEFKRQQDWLELIASENYVSPAVMQSYGNVFTNKYAEWYPWKRYYGGQEYVDRLEILTQFRALAIFDLLEGEVWRGFWRGLRRKEKVWKISYEKYLELEKLVLDPKVSIGRLISIYDEITHKIWRGVNVQPLSGSPANLAVYVGLLQPWDTILGMDLSAGGHLSHWYKITASGKFFNAITYGVRKDNYLIDYDEILAKALKYKPALIIAWYSAHTKDLNYKRFYEIANEVEKTHGYRPILMADIAHIAWLIAGWVLSDDLWQYFDVVTTTTHKTLRWPRWALIYYKKREIEVKKNYKNSLQTSTRSSDLWTLINRGVFPGIQWWPHEHIIAAKAVAFWEILKNEKKDWKKYAQQVVENAQILAYKLIEKWWSVLTGWTENHIVLVNVADSFPELKLDGAIAEQTLEKIWISINKNALPFDSRPPLRPSGIRLWTPAITTRWFKSQDIEILASIIDQALKNYKDQDLLRDLAQKVKELAHKYPLKYDIS